MKSVSTPHRRLGRTEIFVSPVAMGCWPITGMTSLGVTREQSLATLRAALDAGVNFFDTAYMYGRDGESERMIAEAFRGRRSEIVIATKAGLGWDGAGNRQHDARPKTLMRQLDASLRRLDADCVELLYLHAPDPATPIEDSAAAFAKAKRDGKAEAIGASNVTLAQLRTFHDICPVDAVQPAYNMLQRDAEMELIPWCRERQISVCVYWPLLKGLLAGKLPRDIKFDPRDGRAKYPMFQGEQWQKNQDFIDQLRPIADEQQCSLAELVMNWTIHQPGIDVAIAGAKRPEQIEESSRAMKWQLSDTQQQAIATALVLRGQPHGRTAV